MTIPRYDEFFVPMLRILSDGKIHASGEMLTLLADEFAVTEGERSRLSSMAALVGLERTLRKPDS